MNIIETINSLEDIITGTPANIESIQKAEESLKLKFNDEYIQYVSTFGMLVFDGHELTGISASSRLDVVKATNDAKNFYNKVPNDLYVIEFLNIDGLVVWQNSLGEIYLCDMECNLKKICNSLLEYITQ